MKKTKLSSKFWIALTIFSLVGQVAWVVENMYFNVFIYKMFHASAEQISLMVSASAISATLTTIFIGALSDKLGKRKLFICSGYILWGISIWSFSLIRTDVIDKMFPMAVSAASVGVSLVIIMDCVMTFFGSAANDAWICILISLPSNSSCFYRILIYDEWIFNGNGCIRRHASRLYTCEPRRNVPGTSHCRSGTCSGYYRSCNWCSGLKEC